MIEMLVGWTVLAAAAVGACAMLGEIFDWWGRWRKRRKEQLESRIVVLKCFVGPDTPPTDEVRTWVRGLSPWHADAFPLAFREYAPEQGERKAGWFKLDGYGNLIGWVPDGAVVLSPAPGELREKDGRG